MSFQSQPTEHLDDVRQIKNLMERSSRFLSLSGFSGIAAGVCALIGAWIAHGFIFDAYYQDYNRRGFDGKNFEELRLKLLILAAAVFSASLLLAFYFTWRRSNRAGVSVWNLSSRRLMWNTAIPIVAGGLFILGMLFHNEWRFVAPASLFFYGLALVNASKYTLTDIRYLGICEVLLGFVSLFYIGYGLYFWAIGFGLLHIIYGIVMWFRYERNPQ